MKDKMTDLISATKGEMGEIVAENVTPILIESMFEGTVCEMAGGVLSAISPRVGGIVVAYQRKRWERNWEKYIKTIFEKQELLNQRLDVLEQDQLEYFTKNLFPLVSDYVQNERQQEKIELIVNGLIHLAEGINVQEDVAALYYDILEQLNFLDIRILRLYFPQLPRENEENSVTIMREYSIDYSQMRLICEKLDRMGLLQSKNELKFIENMSNIQEYIETKTSSKGKNKAKLKEMQTIYQSDMYTITSFGVKFLKFFSELYIEKNDI